MNESRSESEKKTLKELLIEINNRHGMTNGNSYVAREMVRIYNKYCMVKKVDKMYLLTFLKK